ncbi:hypothetical protein B0H10DRAFT_2009729 [Mycena sp. CBHHK59/15]|nr:hypothetical protein B0H10DRAFT_2009729 [Mycena sp. CBHHK59/15]
MNKLKLLGESERSNSFLPLSPLIDFPLVRLLAMPTAPKKTSKPAGKPTGATKTAAHHPSFIDMIKECIIAHPEDARGGVSRPMIKKFMESKYKVELNASTASQLNRAITSGSERGTFVLPKGPSGKIKLTPKVRGEATKENSKPVSKAKTPTARVPTAKASGAKTAASKPKPAAKTKPKAKTSATTSTVKKAMAPKKVLANKSKPVAKKSTPAAKRTPAKKAVVGKKPAAAKKAVTTKKATTTKKPAAKKVDRLFLYPSIYPLTQTAGRR